MEFVRNDVDALYHEMVVDAMGGQSEYNDGPMAEEPNSKAREFYDLLHATEVHIGVGGQDVTVLSWMAEMLNMKTLYNMSAANWEMALSLSRKLLSPEDQEKRLYMSRKTVEHMTWHLKCREDADEVIHPASSEAWKHFDETHPTFADEPRNVRLGLCIDGFNPFGCSATPYSCWLVFLTVYNLRPEWCYGMLSGWSTHGKLSCPYCMENTKAFQLQYGRKTSFFNCHRQFLPPKHPFCRDKKNFYLNRVEKSRPPLRLDGTLMEERVNQLPDIVFAIKPNASYVLSREQQALICQWLKELRFPDGYASNIARCVNMQELRLFGMKSHDCHVFMQRLLPIAFRDFLIDEVWGPLTEMSNFFRALTASIIQVSNMEMWEEKIVETICKLKKVFPPAFFDLMEHLTIHLPYEAKVGGPVQFRWMYPFERTYYWEEDDARVYKVWRLHCRNRFQDELHRVRKAWVREKKLLEFMHKDTFKILLAKWRSPKYIALQERGRQNRSKGDHVTHTTGCLSIEIHEDRLAAKRGGVRLTPLESYLLTLMTRRPDAPKDAPPAWICPQAEQTYVRI
ncbi:hypothetical protein SLEP1_g34441 [Rubroshorea leprosula]|uniref:DUF4218 domain-containing protein n=1 Tax=Rubroshorea leprosula TaxID=152421 RepID=A0AAV5KJX0_9ROSI|nr:hypothetical protein SLEP1_g34441 [Rubroshorea leprosula]